MKSRKFSKKLSLKKATVSDLNKQEMNTAVGGKFTDQFVYTCYGTCEARTCSCWPPCWY